MVLNPALYDALTTYLGEVRVSQENEHLSWSFDPTKSPPKPRIDAAGEQYYCCCPVCGDTRFRLAIGHRWLTPLDRIHAPSILTHTFKCYNEDCDIREHTSYPLIQSYVNQHKGLIGLAVARRRVSGGGTMNAPVQNREHRLPMGFTRWTSSHRTTRHASSSSRSTALTLVTSVGLTGWATPECRTPSIPRPTTGSSSRSSTRASWCRGRVAVSTPTTPGAGCFHLASARCSTTGTPCPSRKATSSSSPRASQQLSPPAHGDSDLRQGPRHVSVSADRGQLQDGCDLHRPRDPGA